MTYLDLQSNNLSGTPPFAYVAWFRNTSLSLVHYELPKVVVVVVVAAVVAAVQVVLQVTVQAKICTDALSVSYSPGAQVKRKRSSGCSSTRTCPHATSFSDKASHAWLT
jgi:hypothetical protein